MSKHNNNNNPSDKNSDQNPNKVKDGSKLIRRAKNAFINQDIDQTELREIYKFAMPNRNDFDTERDRMVGVFDATAINATARFANRMQSELTPPFQSWFTIKPGPLFVDEDQRLQISEELQTISAVVQATLISGGFTTSSHEVYQDLAAGQGAMLILKSLEDAPVRYVSIPASQVATEEGAWGEQVGLYWKRKIPANQLADFWPKAKFSPELQKAVNQDKTEKAQKMEVFMAFTKGEGDKQWKYDVITGDQNEIIFSETFAYKPFVAPRWSKMSGETRGRGPLHLALPDIQTINKVKELLLMNAALAIVGAYTVLDDGVLNADNLQIVPGALIPVASNGTGFSGPSIRELPTARNFDITQLLIDDLRTSIKKIMLDDQLPPDLGPVRSATEIVERAKELAQDSGAAFGRLMDEWIVPVIQATVDILSDLGVIRASVGDVRLDNITFKIQVLSPLARVQDLADIEVITQYVTIGSQLFGQDALFLSTKLEELLPWIAERMGVPAKFIRNDDERKVVEDQLAQQRQAQAGLLNASNQNEPPQTQEGLLAA